jgi:hypothetical protein
MTLPPKDNLDLSLDQDLNTEKMGFNSFSEKINGRAAMIGFFVFFFFEVLTKQKLTTLL